MVETRRGHRAEPGAPAPGIQTPPEFKPAWKIAMFLLQDLVVLEDYLLVDRKTDETSAAYLVWMCHEVIDNKDWPIDKGHRWIGYIQGVMCAQGWSTVDAERDRVRGVEP